MWKMLSSLVLVAVMSSGCAETDIDRGEYADTSGTQTVLAGEEMDNVENGGEEDNELYRLVSISCDDLPENALPMLDGWGDAFADSLVLEDEGAQELLASGDYTHEYLLDMSGIDVRTVYAGDVDGDGDCDAFVSYTLASIAWGNYYANEVAYFRNEEGRLVHEMNMTVGGKMSAMVDDVISMEDGIIACSLSIWEEEDPGCCPTGKDELYFGIINGEFQLVE